MSEKTIGEKIQDARKKAGLKQWQLANKIHVSESYIALIESNKRNPSMNVLTKIAEVLHLTTDQLVFHFDTRSNDSFTEDWHNLIKNRKPKEIESAIKMLKAYFDCLDELKK